MKIKNKTIEKIKKELLELNFNADSIGLFYWLEAVRIIYTDPRNIEQGMSSIREKIAKKYNTTSASVEREFRTSLEPAKKNIQEKYNYYKKITQITFLNLIRFKLI